MHGILRAVLVTALSLCGTCAYGEELWAIVDAREKGEDNLYVVNVERSKRPSRKLRCEKSLPTYVEEMAASAERVKGKLLVRVQVKNVAEQGGERATDVRVLAIVFAPESNWPILSRTKEWKDFSQALPMDDDGPDPFAIEKDVPDPFAEKKKGR